MKIKRVKLISQHQHNFRHGEENPIVIGVVILTYEDSKDGELQRLCYEVCYPSDGFIDYITFTSVHLNQWRWENLEN